MKPKSDMLCYLVDASIVALNQVCIVLKVEYIESPSVSRWTFFLSINHLISYVLLWLGCMSFCHLRELCSNLACASHRYFNILHLTKIKLYVRGACPFIDFLFIRFHPFMTCACTLTHPQLQPLYGGHTHTHNHKHTIATNKLPHTNIHTYTKATCAHSCVICSSPN